MEATKAPLPMATDEDSEYDQSGGSREGAYCGTRAKPPQTSGGEAIRRADNLSFRTGHHPQCCWEAYGQVVFTGTGEVAFIRRPEWLWLESGETGVGFGGVCCLFFLDACLRCVAGRGPAGADVGDRIWRRRVTSQAPCMVQTAPRTKVPAQRSSIRGWTAVECPLLIVT